MQIGSDSCSLQSKRLGQHKLKALREKSEDAVTGLKAGLVCICASALFTVVFSGAALVSSEIM